MNKTFVTGRYVFKLNMNTIDRVIRSSSRLRIPHKNVSRALSQSSCLRSADKIEVTVEKNGVRRIVINRPELKNGLSFAMLDKLGTTFYESNSDESTKIITITGVGEYFSSGNDLNNWRDTGNYDENKEKSRKNLKQLMFGMMECKKPIVAMVNGGAIGVGTTMLPHCDQVLASDKAFFLTPFVGSRIVPEFGSSYIFPKIMGISKANDMLLFGHRLTAAEALQCGFVSKVFSSDSFTKTCEELVNKYAELPTETMMKSKELIRSPEKEKLRHLCIYDMNIVLDCMDSPYLKDNVKRFLEKKKK